MSPCPERDALVNYESGALNDAEAEPIQRHVESCDACRSTMNRIRRTDDYATKLRRVMPMKGEEGADTAMLLGVDDAATASTTVELADDAAGSSGAPTPVQPEDFGDTDWIIPDYERVVLCDEGSYGSVWAVRDRVGVYRALKLIDFARLRRLGVVCREQSALEAYCRRVPHDPHLITIYHVGIIGDLLYYIMDLADDYGTRGPVRNLFPANYRPLTLDTVLRERALGVDAAIEIARRLLMGLSRLHQLKLIHRDVKPSNIVFVDHRPKLADIGIITTVTNASEKVGTRNYMPPDKVMDMTADTYALGKVLFQMLAGRRGPGFPMPPENRQWEQSRWSRESVGRVIARACAPKAAERYESAATMLDDLERCVEMTVESLFDDIEVADVQPTSNTAREAIQLGYAFLRTLPWIFGIIALLLVISLVT